jgi:hypothetical protein
MAGHIADGQEVPAGASLFSPSLLPKLSFLPCSQESEHSHLPADRLHCAVHLVTKTKSSAVCFFGNEITVIYQYSRDAATFPRGRHHRFGSSSPPILFWLPVALLLACYRSMCVQQWGHWVKPMPGERRLLSGLTR